MAITVGWGTLAGPWEWRQRISTQRATSTAYSNPTGKTMTRLSLRTIIVTKSVASRNNHPAGCCTMASSLTPIISIMCPPVITWNQKIITMLININKIWVQNSNANKFKSNGEMWFSRFIRTRSRNHSFRKPKEERSHMPRLCSSRLPSRPTKTPNTDRLISDASTNFWSHSTRCNPNKRARMLRNIWGSSSKLSKKTMRIPFLLISKPTKRTTRCRCK